MNISIFGNRFRLVGTLTVIYLILSAITRFALFFAVQGSGVTVFQFIISLVIGLVFDLVVAGFIAIPFILQLWLQNNFIYKKRVLPFVILFFAVVLFILLFTGLVPKDFSPQLHKVIVEYVFLRFAIYLFLYFMPQNFRFRWRMGVLYVAFTFVLFLLLLNAVSEWFFWEEFATRYNFIAVDYLVYTTEVLGNISESYPVFYIIPALLAISVALVWITRKAVKRSVYLRVSFAKRSLYAGLLLMAPLITYVIVQGKWRNFSRNEFANALAGNGMYEFALAFNQNQLDFYSFYQTLPDNDAFAILREQLQTPGTRFVSTDPNSIERDITAAGPERHWNVVLISVESLSAGFMKTYGSTKTVTPYLDSLTQKSITFNNLYASGTRTVRGLEALTLAIPPTPGQSIVKRPDNGGLFTLGSVFRSKGYITQYLYGGYSYFDNMKTFFGNNGYTVIDRSAIPAADVHYANIWGVADEDLFTLALRTLDSNYAAHQPFFSHIMTVSNHRPYTYPEGRIDISPTTQTRDGAVKYTDYAINRFLKEAAGKKWFDSTIFVIVADHCASAAGKTALPVTGYHIPMMIYAPALLQPQQVNTLTAQIDVAPTILGLLHFNYRSKFMGQDVLHMQPEQQRAFISTYQGLGYLRNGTLVIQSPVRNVKTYRPDFTTGNATPIPASDSLTKQAIAYYQCASWLVKNKKQTD